MAFAGVLHGIDDIKYQEIKIPEINKDEVLVAVKCSGICGSDIPRVKIKGTYNFPTIPGHEFAGVVYQKGEKVGGVELEDKVTVYPLIPCGECSYCKDGKDNLCDDYNYLGSRCSGGFAEYVKCLSKNVLKISNGVSFEEAALVEPMAVALRGVKRGGVKLGNKVVIFGLGPVGLFATQWAKLNGAERVVGVDRNNHKLKIAEKVGIDYIVDSHGNYEDQIKEIIGPEGADVVLECSGANVFQELAIDMIKKSGIISIVGNPKNDVSFKEKNFQKILRKEITLTGSWNSLIMPGENEWKESLEALASKKIKVDPIITHRFDLKDIKQVFDDLYERKIEDYCKGVFVINEKTGLENKNV